MILKPGVRATGLRPEMLLGLCVADTIYTKYGLSMTVTSLNDSTHGMTSLHYAGCAADLRTKDIPENIDPQKIVAEIKAALGIDYDVILENAGELNEHAHLEYQPRRQ